MKQVLCYVTFLSYLSCGIVERRSHSGVMKKQNFDFYRPGEDFKVAIGDGGSRHKSRRVIMDGTPDNTIEKIQFNEENSLKNELSILEGLQSQLLYEHYSRYEFNFENISEKIYFLKLQSLQERENYLRLKGIIAKKRTQSPSSHSYSFESGTILWGMDKLKVQQILGQPRQVDYAGDPDFENERWGYATENDGMTRYIYFENGKVDGWEHVQDF